MYINAERCPFSATPALQEALAVLHSVPPGHSRPRLKHSAESDQI